MPVHELDVYKRLARIHCAEETERRAKKANKIVVRIAGALLMVMLVVDMIHLLCSYVRNKKQSRSKLFEGSRLL